ncbi:MAG: hypothetical protein V4687_04060 [Bacteroidota bacterium]
MTQLSLIAFVIIAFPALSLGQTKKQSLNDFGKDEIYYYTGISSSTAKFDYLQIAQRLETPVVNAVLNSVEISRMMPYYQDVRIINFDVTTFKINIFNTDPITNGPGKVIKTAEILIKDKRSRTITVNLDKYKIKIPGKSFFISIEFIRDKVNERLTPMTLDGNVEPLSVDLKPHQFIGSYQPYVGMSPIKGKQINTWALTQYNKWVIYDYFAPDYTDFAISAVISY